MYGARAKTENRSNQVVRLSIWQMNNTLLYRSMRDTTKEPSGASRAPVYLASELQIGANLMYRLNHYRKDEDKHDMSEQMGLETLTKNSIDASVVLGVICDLSVL